MDAAKVGKAIAFLRKKVGYTQKELAERIGVSDKAVSKWERGLGMPDTSIIGKIAILLDSDTDSLLTGDLVHHDSNWSGLLVLPNCNIDIYSGTIIYDKPIVYFLLGYFMLMGIRNIRVVSNDKDRQYISQRIGSGKEYGISLTYFDQIPLEEYDKDEENVMVIYGMTFLYGVDQTRFFQKAMLNKDRVTVLSLPKRIHESPKRIFYNSDKRIVNAEDGERIQTQYDYYQLPFFFCPSRNIKDMFSDKEISYIDCKSLDGEYIYTVVLDRGFVDIPLNNYDDVANASMFVKIVQNACGMQIYNITEIAWRRGMISHEAYNATKKNDKNRCAISE